MSLIKRLERSFSTKLSFFILLFTTCIFLITFFIFYFFTSKTLREDARTNAENLLNNINLKIEDVLTTVKTVPDNLLWAVIERGFHEDSLYAFTRDVLARNEYVYGSAVAFEPNYFKDKGHYFSPYSYKEGNKIHSMQLGTDTYDYHSMEWYDTPKKLGQPYWTEPYFDEGGGEMLMLTYSNPIHDKDKNFIGILTVDVSLDWLSDLINEIHPYPSSYFILLGRDGVFIIHPDKEMILQKNIFYVAEKAQDENIDALALNMLNGVAGMAELKRSPFQGEPSYVFYKPLSFNDWSLGMIVPKKEVFSRLALINKIIIPLIIICLLLLFVFCMYIVKSLTRPLKLFSVSARKIATGDFNYPLPVIKSKDEMMELHDSFHYMQEQLTNYIEELKITTGNKERIESELRIASDIQMGMIPKIFPPFPERDDVDLYAVLKPAKEVGGDLYDFFIDSGKLFFIIGDVSGKGVPASLFMAVTRSIFRSIAIYYSNSKDIVSAMNNSMVESNDSNMFVTLFVGILDLATGNLSYCNAGHNPPVLIQSAGEETNFMKIIPNVPIGLFANFQFRDESIALEKESTLFLYTDGLTEAENREYELFSENALIENLKQIPDDATPKTTTDLIIRSVKEHADEAEQSDDLTIMTIKYLGPEAMKRKLVITNEISEISKLSQFIEEIGEELSLSPGLIMNLNLVLEEAVSNIILYAFPKKKDQDITVDLRKTNNSLIITITDEGVEFDPTKVDEADITLSAEDRPIGGLGIFLIKKIMNEVEYQRIDGTNVFTLKKKLD